MGPIVTESPATPFGSDRVWRSRESGSADLSEDPIVLVGASWTSPRNAAELLRVQLSHAPTAVLRHARLGVLIRRECRGRLAPEIRVHPPRRGSSRAATILAERPEPREARAGPMRR